jgi:hypothetical protein
MAVDGLDRKRSERRDGESESSDHNFILRAISVPIRLSFLNLPAVANF